MVEKHLQDTYDQKASINTGKIDKALLKSSEHGRDEVLEDKLTRLREAKLGSQHGYINIDRSKVKNTYFQTKHIHYTKCGKRVEIIQKAKQLPSGLFSNHTTVYRINERVASYEEVCLLLE